MVRFKMLAAVMLVAGCVLCLSGSPWAGETGQVNINTASAEELATLKKVGPKTADKIIEYRTAVGPFNAPEELMNVKGIGEKIFELNKDRIIVGSPDASSLKKEKGSDLKAAAAGKQG